MASNIKLSTGFKNALLNGTDATSLFDGSNASITIYSGQQPATADDAVSGGSAALSVIDLPSTNAFSAAANGGALAKSTAVWEDTAADASGTAAWFRLAKNDTVSGLSITEIRIDGSVGVGTAFDMNLSTASITAADPIIVDVFTLRIT